MQIINQSEDIYYLFQQQNNKHNTMGTYCEGIAISSDLQIDHVERLRDRSQYHYPNSKPHYESVSIGHIKTYKTFLEIIRKQIENNQHIYRLLSLDAFHTIFEELDKYYFAEERLLDIIKELIKYMKQCLNRLVLKENHEYFFYNFGSNIRRVWDEAYFQNKNILRVMSYLIKGTNENDCFLKLQFNLDPNETMKVADKTWQLCNFDERAFLFLTQYLNLSCINLQKKGKKLQKIEKLLISAINAVCRKYPKSCEVDTLEESSIYRNGKTEREFKFNLINLNQFKQVSKKETLQKFIQKQLEQVKNNYNAFAELVEETCKEKGYHFNIRVKSNNQFHKRSIENIVEKVIGSTFTKYSLQDYMKQHIQVKTVQSFIHEEEKCYEIQIEQILNRVNKPIAVEDLNLIKATCFFRTIQDMNDCKQKLKQKIQLSNCQLIEQNNLMGVITSKILLKIMFQNIIAQIQLLLDINIAEKVFASKMHEISKSIFFSPFTMLKIINEQITNDYLKEVIECLQSNNANSHQYQLIIYSSSLTKEAFKDISFKRIEKSLKYFLKMVEFSANNANNKKETLVLLSIIKQFQVIQTVVNNIQGSNSKEITMPQQIKNSNQYLQKIKQCEFSFMEQKKYLKQIEKAQILCPTTKIQEGFNQIIEKAKFHRKMGEMHQQQGNFDMAMQEYMKQLEIQETILGLQAIDCASTHNKIGTVYVLQNLYDLALISYLRCLQLQEKAFGKQAIKCAATHNSIANVYQNQGLLQKALIQCKKCLQIQEAVLGKQSVKCAFTHNNIGNLYKFQGFYDLSLKQYMTCLQIEERVLGKSAIDCALTLWNIALVYQKLKNKDQLNLYKNMACLLKRKYPLHKFPF